MLDAVLQTINLESIRIMFTVSFEMGAHILFLVTASIDVDSSMHTPHMSAYYSLSAMVGPAPEVVAYGREVSGFIVVVFFGSGQLFLYFKYNLDYNLKLSRVV